MKKQDQDAFWRWGLIAGVLLIAVGVGLYFLQREPAPAPAEPVAVSAPTPPPAAAPSTPSPVVRPPEPERALPLPALDQSDPELLGGLTELLGPDAVMKFLVPERLIRNIVVTIDNAPRQQMAVNQRPIRPTPGDFVVAGPEDARVLAPENYERYTPFVTVVRNLDAKTLVAVYRGLRPLFQQAYEELGHPNDVFEARLLEVIDHLLAAPSPPAEIRLVQPSVVFRYADERLEKLSAGQKLLLRMGPTNAAVIKAKLREIRSELN